MADKIVHQGLVPSCSQYTMIILTASLLQFVVTFRAVFAFVSAPTVTFRLAPDKTF